MTNPASRGVARFGLTRMGANSRVHLARAAFLTGAILSASCSGGGGEDPITTTAGAVLSPPSSSSSPYSVITVEVAADGFTATRVRNETLESLPGAGSTVRQGLLDGDRFWVVDVPLTGGGNVLVVEAATDGAFEVVSEISVLRTAVDVDLPSLAVSPSAIESSGPAEVAIKVDPNGVGGWSVAFVDAEGDGPVDETVNAAQSLSWTYDIGAHRPRAHFRMAGGVTVTSPIESTSMVSVLPPSPSTDSTTAFVSDVPLVDLEHLPIADEILGLDSQGDLIRFGLDGTTLQVIANQGWGLPSGLTLDASGRVYLAEPDGHRVWRLDPASGFALDAAFGNGGQVGSFGSEPGMFIEPTDLCVAEVGGIERLYVTDRGNDRVQRFSLAGLFEAQFAMEGASGGTFDAPTRIQGIDPLTVAVMDADELWIVSSAGELRNFVDTRTLVDSTQAAVDIATGGIRELWLAYASGDVVLVDADSTVVRASDTGFVTAEPRVIEADLEPLWQVVATGGTSSTTVSLEHDAPGAAPEDVVATFLTAVIDGDETAALEHSGPAIQSIVAQMLADPEGRATLGALDIDPRLVWRTSATAEVLVHDLGDPDALPFDVSLLADPLTGTWRISQL